MNFHRSVEDPESPDEFRSLLERYITLAPCLIPLASNGTDAKTLSHPDLHLDNIFFAPETGKIVSIIDWESASICEMFLQRGIPPLLRCSDIGSSDQARNGRPEEHKSNKVGEQDTDLLSCYKHLTKTTNPRRWSVLTEEKISLLKKPVSLVCDAWNRKDVFSFRHALINVVANWKRIAPDTTPCPIDFTEAELALHGEEIELLEGLGSIMHQLQDTDLIPLGGMVRCEQYNRAQEANMLFRDEFIALAEDDRQKVVHLKV
jgi:hypothetical protein